MVKRLCNQRAQELSTQADKVGISQIMTINSVKQLIPSWYRIVNTVNGFNSLKINNDLLSKYIRESTEYIGNGICIYICYFKQRN